MKTKLKTTLVSGLLGVVLAGAVAAAPAGAQTPHPKINHWVHHQGGAQMIRNLVTDLTSVSDTASAAADSGETGDIMSACQTLQSDVADAQAGAPIPSKGIERLWTHVLNAEADAATQCITGLDDNDANGELEQSASDQSSATGYLSRMTAEIKA